jgi:hypothetical protein
LAATVDITVNRQITVSLDPPGTLQGLLDVLAGLVARPAIGPDAFVETLRGQGMRFELVLHKPDP